MCRNSSLAAVTLANGSWPVVGCDNLTVDALCQGTCNYGFEGTPATACLVTGKFSTILAANCKRTGARVTPWLLLETARPYSNVVHGLVTPSVTPLWEEPPCMCSHGKPLQPCL